MDRRIAPSAGSDTSAGTDTGAPSATNPEPAGETPAAEQLRKPSRADLLRHVLDGAASPVAYLAVNAAWGPRWGALAAFVVALVVAGIRRRRGEPLVVVTIATAFVAMLCISAVAVGEGRAFFLPELILNIVAFVVCLGSLLIARPVTGSICRRVGLETAPRQDPDARRRHRRLTLAWTAMWIVHIVPFTWAYLLDSVAALTVLGTFLNKPTIVAMVVVTVVGVRRGRPAPTDPTPADPSPTHQPTHAAEPGGADRKDPS